MIITVLAQGSRGDVQPPLALAQHLVDLGHTVRVAVPADFAPVARRMAVEVWALPFVIAERLAEGNLTDSLRRGKTLAFFKEGFQRDVDRRGPVIEMVERACVGADVILVPALLEDIAMSIAEKHGLRVALLLPMPTWANSLYPSFIFAAWKLPRWANRLTYWLTERAARSMLPSINEMRAQLHMSAVRERPGLALQRTSLPVFYWVSSEVLPRPPEFRSNHHFTGYWHVPPAVRAAFGETAPARELVAFLDGGPPPVYLGFGSMPVMDERVLAIAVEVARRMDVRMVVARGKSSITTPNDRVLVIDDVDHDWLFPRCLAAIHHGGASTTGAAVRAGVPHVVCAVFADQPLWGRRVEALGVGEMLRFQRLTPSTLAAALSRSLRAAPGVRARALAAVLAAQPSGALVTARHVHDHGRTYPVPR